MSERVSDEITGLEQNILSKSNYMSKNIKLNLNYLKLLSKNAKREDVKEKVKKTLSIYMQLGRSHKSKLQRTLL